MQFGLALEVVEQLDFTRVRSVLDVGCGSGRVTQELARRAPSACVLGVDSSPAMVDFARKHYASDHVFFLQGDAAALELEERYDLITSFACLHWLSDPARAVAAMATRLLAPGGLLRVQMGGAGNLGSVLQQLESLLKTERWKPYFQNFRFPWSFWGVEPYQEALQGLEVQRLELIERTARLDTAEDFKRWFQAGWRPYVERLPAEQLDPFLEQLLEGHTGPVEVPMVRVDLAVRGN